MNPRPRAYESHALPTELPWRLMKILKNRNVRIYDTKINGGKQDFPPFIFLTGDVKMMRHFIARTAAVKAAIEIGEHGIAVLSVDA